MKTPTAQDASEAPARGARPLPDRAGVAPLSPTPLALSIVAIAVAAVVIAAMAAATAALVLYLDVGGDDFHDILTDLAFDPILQARLGAAKVSLLYGGVAAATLGAARLRGRRAGWQSLLASGPGRWRRRDVVPIALVTLGYAAAFTALQVVGRDIHLLTLGPTDFVLLGTLTANLVILAPLAEELFFRGWLYTALRARWRFLPSFLLTAAAFAAMHWFLDHRHPLRVLPLALAVGLLRELTGSVRASIALHGAYNLLIVAITLAAV